MNTIEITNLLRTNRKTAPLFLGVFAADEGPRQLPSSGPFVLVKNVMPGSHGGLHWVAISRSANKRRIDYFDSMGMRANEMNETFLRRLGSNYFYSKRIIQAPTSNICGLYVALFCFYKSSGMSLGTIVKKFRHKRFYENDCKLIRLVKRVFGTELKLKPTPDTNKYCKKKNMYK